MQFSWLGRQWDTAPGTSSETRHLKYCFLECVNIDCPAFSSVAGNHSFDCLDAYLSSAIAVRECYRLKQWWTPQSWRNCIVVLAVNLGRHLRWVPTIGGMDLLQMVHTKLSPLMVYHRWRKFVWLYWLVHGLCLWLSRQWASMSNDRQWQDNCGLGSGSSRHICIGMGMLAWLGV